MKLISKKTLLVTASILMIGFAASDANAQTANVTAQATVSNTLTVGTTTNMNFGTVVAVGDTGQNATISIDEAGAVTVGTSGGTAITAIVDDSAATAAQVTVGDGAPGGTINVTINNLTDLTDGTDVLEFDTGAFLVSQNGSAATTEAATVAFQITYDGLTNPNTLDIGATIQTEATQTGPLNDAVYNGGFDVVFAY